MIDNVNGKFNNEPNPFMQFNSSKRQYYFVAPNNTPPQDSYTGTKDSKDTKKLGKTIVLSTLGLGAGILFLMRGMPKGVYKTLEKWMQSMETKLQKQRKNGKVGRFEEVYTFTISKLSSFLGKAKSINNFVSIKDIFFEKIMSRSKFTQKVHSKITEIYENIGRGTVRNSYKTSKTKLLNVFQTFENYDDKILSRTQNGTKVIEGKTVQEWLDEIEQHKSLIKKLWNSEFGERAQVDRYKNIKTAIQNLPDEVWDSTVGSVNNLTRKELYETFIAEEKLAGKKLGLQKEVKQVRNKITRDIDDIYENTIDILSGITSFVNSKDTKTRELIKEIRLQLSDWKQLSGSKEQGQRQQLNKNITKLLKELSQNINETKEINKYNKEAVNQMIEHINEIDKIIGENGKGSLEEIYTIYKKLLPRDEYLALKKQTKKDMKYLDYAISKETDSFFDMMRDLKLGSAPTDILSILVAIGAVGTGLSKAENNEQKKSVLLRAGIPAIGAISTSLYFSASLVSGGKSLLYGAISGAILNYIGSKLDIYHKKHSHHKKELMANSAQTT